MTMAGAYPAPSAKKMDKEAAKYAAEMDLKALIEAEKIKKDSARYKAAMMCAKEQMKAMESIGKA
jgi:hypothetical protein